MPFSGSCHCQERSDWRLVRGLEQRTGAGGIGLERKSRIFHSNRINKPVNLGATLNCPVLHYFSLTNLMKSTGRMDGQRERWFNVLFLCSSFIQTISNQLTNNEILLYGTQYNSFYICHTGRQGNILKKERWRKWWGVLERQYKFSCREGNRKE